MADPQDVSEALDADVIDDDDDYTGEGLGEYPPDLPLAMDELGVTAEEVSIAVDGLGDVAGEGIDLIQLYDDGEFTGEAMNVDGIDLTAEEAAIHVIPEP